MFLVVFGIVGGILSLVARLSMSNPLCVSSSSWNWKSAPVFGCRQHQYRLYGASIFVQPRDLRYSRSLGSVGFFIGLPFDFDRKVSADAVISCNSRPFLTKTEFSILRTQSTQIFILHQHPPFRRRNLRGSDFRHGCPRNHVFRRRSNNARKARDHMSVQIKRSEERRVG